MASRNKKTTFAKLNREQNQRERRIEKKARKDARKLAALDEASRPEGELSPDDLTTDEPSAEPDPAPASRPE